PYDPWFAGGFLNYYYFGFVIVGTLVHPTGIAPATAYNLAVPTLFALTALGAWCVAFNLVAIAKSATTEEKSDTPEPFLRRERRAIATGLAAAAFVVLLGPITQALWFLPGSAKADPTLPADCQQLTTYASQQACRGRSEWAFWDATRLVGMSQQDSTINEFPFFTFLFADMHAHMMSLPLALLALGLMVALIKGATPPGERRWRFDGAHVLAIALLALVIGALRATNTWDFPAYLALGMLTLGLLAWRRLQLGASMPHTALAWLGGALALLVGSSMLFLPFLRSFATDYAGFELWRGTRTSAADILRINGLW
ncbi:hypothetical protein SE17_37655, partial [Kouleothrix aurantiaca]